MTVTASQPVRFVVGMSDANEVTERRLLVDNVLQGRMTLQNGVVGAPRIMSGAAVYDHTFSAPSSYAVVEIECQDGRGNVSERQARAYTVGPSTVSIGIPSFNPATLSAASPVVISSTYVNPGLVEISACALIVQDQATARDVHTALMTLSDGGRTSRDGNMTYTYTPSSAGTYDFRIECTLFSPTRVVSQTLTAVRVNATAPPVADIIVPIVGSVSPLSAIVGVSVNLQATYSDNVGVNSCVLYVDNVSQGGGSLSGTTATKGYVFGTAGTHTARFVCTDAAGNRGEGLNSAVSVNLSSAPPDVTRPVLGAFGPVVATVGASVNYTIIYSDTVGVTSCLFYADGLFVGSADRVGLVSGNASRSHVFNSSGAHTVHFVCSDAAGNQNESSRYSIIVTALATSAPLPTSTPIPVTGQATIGGLIKLVCPPVAVSADHPCKAVYYYGRDGKRHAFPNERVYFTWYVDFAGVTEVSATALAAIPLGRNVTYRPGLRLVKFLTLNRVYVVERGGVLRWITSEISVRELYGPNWNRNVDDIADVFYANYQFGPDVTSASQFSPTAQTAVVTNIDQNW